MAQVLASKSGTGLSLVSDLLNWLLLPDFCPTPAALTLCTPPSTDQPRVPQALALQPSRTCMRLPETCLEMQALPPLPTRLASTCLMACVHGPFSS